MAVWSRPGVSHRRIAMTEAESLPGAVISAIRRGQQFLRVVIGHWASSSVVVGHAAPIGSAWLPPAWHRGPCLARQPAMMRDWRPPRYPLCAAVPSRSRPEVTGCALFREPSAQ